MLGFKAMLRLPLPSFPDYYFLPKRDMLEKLRFRALKAIILDRKARSENESFKITSSTQIGGDSQKKVWKLK